MLKVRWQEEWSVKNSSGQTLYILPDNGNHGVVPVDSFFVIKDAFYYEDVENEYLYCAKLWEWLGVTEIQVFSADDRMLVKWTMESDRVEHDFFDEKVWDHDYNWYFNAPQTRKWIFEILPEDLAVSD